MSDMTCRQDYFPQDGPQLTHNNTEINVTKQFTHLKKSNNETIINLEAFGDLVESIYQELLKLAQTKQLEITLKGGSDELVRRYSFSTQTGS
jgi:hypothetical protein